MSGGVRIVTLEEFVSVEEASAEPLMGEKNDTPLSAAATLFMYGQAGSSKTTLTVDAVAHLAAGVPWLGIAVPRPLRILLIENEGPRGAFRGKLAAKTAAWAGPSFSGNVHVLEEPWNGFSFADVHTRDPVTTFIEQNNVDLLVAGPLATLGTVGAGTPEEVTQFALLLSAMRDELARPLAIWIVHHTNKQGSISGAWERLPDSTAHVQGQGHGRCRLFWEKARFASTLHGTTMNLLWADGAGFTVEERDDVTEDTIAEGILAAARELPGGSWTKLRKLVKGNGTEASRVRDRLIGDGLLVNGAARQGQFNLWEANDPASPRSELRTGLERAVGATPDGAAAQSRSPVPDVSRNGERNGTAEPGSTPPEQHRLEVDP